MDAIGEFMHFRVHTDELELKDLIEFLHEQSIVHFVVKEFGQSNREHIHACLKLKCPRTTFTDRLKSKFKVIKGNGYYSLKKLKKDYDTNARYCYKGKANDYPDIIYTIHTEEQWKKYYKSYWEQFKELHPPPVSNVVKTTRVKTRTFTQKLVDEIMEDYNGLALAIWHYKGYKSKTLPKEDVEYYQDYLGELLLMRLGQAVKNIDSFIYERMYKALWYGILSRCPENILKQDSKEMIQKFRHTL